MLSNKSNLLKSTLCVVVASGLLSGCAQGEKAPVIEFAKWEQMQAPVAPQVEPITIDHRVPFQASRADVSPVARDTIMQFLRESGVALHERVELDGPRNDAGFHTPLTSARLSAVQSELQRRGYNAQIADLPSPTALPSDQVSIAVTRVMVVQPDCGGSQPQGGYLPTYHFGCSTTANLGLMVANPADLQHGRPLAPQDGTTAAAAIDRYRTDKVKALTIENTK